MKQAFIKRGYVQEFLDRDARRLPKENGFFDLQKWIKRALNWLHITYVDPCCDAEKNEVPVRYNKDNQNLEMYNIGTDSWVAINVGSGGGVGNFVETNEDYAATADDSVILVDTTTGDIEITLPDPTENIGKVFTIKKIDVATNVVNFTPSLDGDPAFELDAQNESVTVVSNGTSYYII